MIDLDIARQLIDWGVPLFVAAPCPQDCEKHAPPGSGHGGTGFHLPPKWETSRPTPDVVNRWRPGWALCAVMGHAFDGWDSDPRHGGMALPESTRSYGRALTPSGGTHDLIAPLGAGSLDGVLGGVDVKGGKPDGEGRGFLFIAPTVKASKVTGVLEPYRWIIPPSTPSKSDDSGAWIATLIAAKRTPTTVAGLLAGGSGEHEGPIPHGQRHVALVRYSGHILARHPRLTEREHQTLLRARLADCEIRPGETFEGLWVGVRDGLASSTWRDFKRGDVEPKVESRPASESTWLPEDLTAIVAGDHRPELPALMPRDDGPCLLYRGRVHSLHGESESGKSMLAQLECARILKLGGAACYIDFESDASVVVGRLLEMGAPGTAILGRFTYLRPEVAPEADQDREAWLALLDRDLDVAVIDGVTEAMGVYRVESSNNNDQTAAWVRGFPRRLAQRTGAAVMLIDHVTKSSDSRGRFAIGAQAKMSALDGAGYVVEVKRALGRGMRGAVSMRVAKDRPGGVRPECGEFSATDRTQEAAYVIIDSTAGGILHEVRPPLRGDAALFADMEKVSQVLESAKFPLPFNRLRDASGMREDRVRFAANRLAASDLISIEQVGNTFLHRSLGAFRAREDDAGLPDSGEG